jgi:EAL domain-containing protein (putative c-di-GMP-specific phosphodiesterase class I)
VRRFDAALARETRERRQVAGDLRAAVERDELELHFQPVVDLRADGVVACEALVRWAHPTRGRLLPGAFIPVAEDDGQIVAIGEWVLRQACRQGRAWRDAGGAVEVAVNVSARQLARPDFLRTVRDALADSGLPAPALCLEVTETAVLRRPDEVAETLAELRRSGVRIALDDFGEGHSSLRHLRALPADVLKVDRSFVADVHRDPASRALVESLCALGRALGLVVVAEGVELQQQDDVLRGMGCPRAQGFLYGRPRPAAELDVTGYVGAGARGVGDPLTVREFMRQIGIPARIDP